MASKLIKGLTVEIGGDTTKLGKALESVEKQSKGLSTELKGINSLLKLNPTNVTLLAQKQKVLTEAVEATKEKLKTLKDTQAQVQAQFDKGEITEEQYRSFQREIVATETKLKSLTQELRNFGTVGAQQVAAVGEKMKDFGGKVEGAGKKLKGVSTAAAAGLTLVSKNAIDFESAWAGVTKTVDGTPEQLEEVKQGLLDMSQETASSAIDIAAVAEAAGQLGIKTENILDFTKTMVMLGDSTNMSADEAATSLARFANITQMSADDYGKLGSVVVDLGNNFATTEADIVAMATRLASTGEIAGLSEPQIFALATTMSSVGIEAEAGGTAISKLLKKMLSCNAGFDEAQKTVNATGMSLRDLQLMQSLNSTEFKNLAGSMGLTTDELKSCMDNVAMMNQYASAAGVSVEDFRKAYAEDAVGALSMFITGLSDTERNGKTAIEILNEMGLTEVRLSNAILAMSTSGDLLNNTLSTANTAWGENSALTTEAEKRYATTASQIQQLKGAITEMCVQLGETLLPIIQSVVGKLKEWVNWFTNLSPATQKVILAVTALVAAAAPVLIMVGKIISSIGTIMTYAPQIATVLKGIGTVFSTLASLVTKGLGLLMTGLKGLFALVMAHPVIAIITAIVAAVILLWNKCEWFRNAVIAIWNAIKAAFAAVLNWFSEGCRKLGQFFVNAWNAIKEIWNNSLIKRYFLQIWESIKGIFAAVKAVLSGNFREAWEAIKGVFAGWGQFFSSLWDKVKSVFSTAWSYMKNIGLNIVQGLWNGISGAASWLWEKITGFGNSIIGWFKGIFGIKSPSRVFAELGGYLDQGLAKGITDGMDDPIKAAQQMADGVLDSAQGLNGLSLENNLRQRSVQMAAEVTAKSDNTMLGKLDRILTAIEKGQVLTIDGRQLVGHTAVLYDNALGQRQMLAARGAI